MTHEELLNVKHNFDEVKYVHDNLPPEQQNEIAIENCFKFVNETGCGFGYLKDVVRLYHTLKFIAK